MRVFEEKKRQLKISLSLDNNENNKRNIAVNGPKKCD